MGVTRGALHAERRSLRATLLDVGPDAPTLCPPWTAAQMAAHIVGGEAGMGLMSFAPRHLVGRGVRIGSGPGFDRARDRLLRRFEAKGFDWALDRLDAPPPVLLSRGTPGLVSFFETWTHHEDVRRANGRGADPARETTELWACLAFVGRYQRRLLGGAVEVQVPGRDPIRLGTGEPRVSVRGSVADVLLWLAGRDGAASVEVQGPTRDGDDMGQRLRI